MNRGRFQRTRTEDRTRINDMIRVPQIRVINQDGESIGIITTAEAQQMATEAGLDLVEVAPNATPPVCRIMDYGKYKYEKSKKAKEAKKKQHTVHLKEIKFHPKTEEHDYSFKMDHARKFLLKGDRVKATVVFRGREITHIDFGRKILERFNEDISDIATSEQLYRMEGRNMISIYLPDKAKIREYKRKVAQEQKKVQKETAGE
ncbi:MAG: translation initiation factor IF-3 [Chitinivibrionales bacterium]